MIELDQVMQNWIYDKILCRFQWDAYWRICFVSSIFILFVLLIRYLLRNRSKKYSYYLWILAVLRLLCPISFTIPVASLVTRAEIMAAENTYIENFLPPVMEMILLGIYAMGAFGMGIYYIVQYMKARKKVSRAYKGNSSTWLCREIETPFVMGVFRPRIYLPAELENEEKVRICILAHEKSHVKHQDTRVRFLALLCICLYWWNPLVWIAVKIMSQDMEMYCDEKAVSAATAEEKKLYANTLLSYAMRSNGFREELAFGESNTEKRVKNIFTNKRGGASIVIIFLLAVTCCLALFFVRINNPLKILTTESVAWLEEVIPSIESIYKDGYIPGGCDIWEYAEEECDSYYDRSNDIYYDSVCFDIYAEKYQYRLDTDLSEKSLDYDGDSGKCTIQYAEVEGSFIKVLFTEIDDNCFYEGYLWLKQSGGSLGFDIVELKKQRLGTMEETYIAEEWDIDGNDIEDFIIIDSCFEGEDFYVPDNHHNNFIVELDNGCRVSTVLPSGEGHAYTEKLQGLEHEETCQYYEVELFYNEDLSEYGTVVVFVKVEATEKGVTVEPVLIICGENDKERLEEYKDILYVVDFVMERNHKSSASIYENFREVFYGEDKSYYEVWGTRNWGTPDAEIVSERIYWNGTKWAEWTEE